MRQSKKPITQLFVYGSLAPGQANAHILAPLKGTWRKAMVRGFLHNAGWGAGGGYPGLELDPRGDEIQGQIFSSKGLPDFWETLDAFEGKDYIRLQTDADLPNGKTVRVYVYALASP